MKKIAWSDVSNGDIIFIDNYEDGKYPMANTKMSGPFYVVDVERRWLLHENSKRFLCHYPNNLLKEEM